MSGGASAAAPSIVKGVKTIMVNGPLRTAARRRAGPARRASGRRMAAPLKTDPKASATPAAPIASALRTLEAEAGGVAALAAALQAELGPSFLAAVELIRNAKGRVIVTGL